MRTQLRRGGGGGAAGGGGGGGGGAGEATPAGGGGGRGGGAARGGGGRGHAPAGPCSSATCSADRGTAVLPRSRKATCAAFSSSSARSAAMSRVAPQVTGPCAARRRTGA